jgi:hypothetical protein
VARRLHAPSTRFENCGNSAARDRHNDGARMKGSLARRAASRTGTSHIRSERALRLSMFAWSRALRLSMRTCGPAICGAPLLDDGPWRGDRA